MTGVFVFSIFSTCAKIDGGKPSNESIFKAIQALLAFHVTGYRSKRVSSLLQRPSDSILPRRERYRFRKEISLNEVQGLHEISKFCENK